MEAQAEPVAINSPVPPYEAWPSLQKGPIDSSVSTDRTNVMDVDNVISPTDRHSRATSALSMDDIEAAQALEGLRADYVQSPTRSVASLPLKIDPALRSSDEPEGQPEPLLSLLTSQHPLISTAINGSLSAYSSSKSYSPRFRQGAEFVERNIASPVASTVGTAGRISGVETGVRWWLQRSDSNGAGEGRHKRRRMNDDRESEMDVEKGLRDVTLQPNNHPDLSPIDTLPAYDDQRSPRYEEHNSITEPPPQRARHDMSSPRSRTWQSRLMLSTSGLGVAMSDESLRSLKYCLSWLRWANTHLNRVLLSLQSVLDEWDRSHQPPRQEQHDPSVENRNAEPEHSSLPPRDDAILTHHLLALKAECLQTLKNVVDIVSKYAGGSLPENARILVRRHLTSLPQRFRIAATTSSSSSSSTDASSSSAANGGANAEAEKGRTPEVVFGAQKVVVLAKEGLDMMAQVSGVVGGTIVSAEEWCERLGRKRKEEVEGEGEGMGERRVDEKGG